MPDSGKSCLPCSCCQDWVQSLLLPLRFSVSVSRHTDLSWAWKPLICDLKEHSLMLLVPRSWMSRNHTSSPPQAPPQCIQGKVYFTWSASYQYTTVYISHLSPQRMCSLNITMEMQSSLHKVILYTIINALNIQSKVTDHKQMCLIYLWHVLIFLDILNHVF
jgi:hypothetical protein